MALSAYSPNVVEGEFSEVRLNGVLGSSQKKVSNLVHLGDAPTTIEEDATTVTRQNATSREGAGQLPALLLDRE